MRINISDLEKALNWVKKNSNEEKVFVSIDNHLNCVVIKTYDRFSAEVVMKLPNEGTTYAKITRTEDL